MQIRSQNVGFTLIELMIIVLVVAILAAVAWPSYDNFIRRTRLENARSELLSNAQMLERFYTQCHTFTAAASAAAPCNTAVALSNNGQSSRFFNIQFAASSPSANAFVIEARPNNNNSDPRYVRYDSTTHMMLCNSSDECEPY